MYTFFSKSQENNGFILCKIFSSKANYSLEKNNLYYSIQLNKRQFVTT